MTTIPWRESAVLTREHPGDFRSIVMEGSLADVAKYLSANPHGHVHFRVALPDRMIAPREWDSEAITDLVSAYKARPSQD